MRVIAVAAHFPPNFVSGATIITERTARRLQSLGHEVAVFAGWTGADRAPLSSWDENMGGLPVHWIVTTPWTAWQDPKNYDNPDVAERFGKFLDRLPADVVHFHSLQSLGIGLVQAASERGIPTVVTMHDFWWWCPRQFLCDRRYHPCCLVVEAGMCGCESGRDELEIRSVKMRPALACIDRIIAVSEISARVIIANGADPGRVVVVENGIPSPERSPRPARTESPTVRFLYAGGPDRMKGPHVLAEAVRMLQPLQGWSVDCYGCEIWRNRLSSPAVRVLPAFSHAELDPVLASVDVLVLPSVARESYSILAREALSRGRPVISSDCLGPQEVVRHRDNGLIIPSGDSAALATAMRILVEEPETLDRLRSGCRDVALSSEDDQVDAVERIYAELASGGSGRVSKAEPAVNRVLFAVGIDGAPLRYRAWFPAEGLRDLGVHVDVLHYRHPDVARFGAQADVVVLYRVPATVQILEFITDLRSRGVPVVFDVDDLIFEPKLADRTSALGSLSPEENALWHEGIRRYRATMQQCDAFFGSTPALVGHAEDAGRPGRVFPNGIGKLLAQASDRALARPRRRGPLRLGYLSGTKTHQADWAMVEPAVAKVLGAVPEAELYLVGLIEPTPVLAPYRHRIVLRPFVPWWKLPDVLRDLDVHLAPLVLGDPFNECKSAIKWLEAGLVSTPTVASPTGPFRDVIRDGENGCLATTEDDWFSAIRTLLESPEERSRMGAAARRDALLDFAPSIQARSYLRLLSEVQSGTAPPEEYPGHLPDEPPRLVKLEPYELPAGRVVGRARAVVAQRIRQSERANRVAEAVREGRRTLAEQGLSAFLARAARMARRILSRKQPDG